MSRDYGRKQFSIQISGENKPSKSFICPLLERLLYFAPVCSGTIEHMLKSIITICIKDIALRFLAFASFLASLIQTCIEWYELDQVFKAIREHQLDLDINPVQFRTSLGLTVILFGATVAIISPKLSKIALVLMTCIFVFYWGMLFNNGGHRLSWPFRAGQFGFVRSLTFVAYETAPLIALLIGYWVWVKKYNSRLIAATGVMCVVFQFFTWFVDTRLMANMDSAGTSYQYPPITINATFFGATLGYVVLLILCIITAIAFEIAIRRNDQSKEFRHL